AAIEHLPDYDAAEQFVVDRAYAAEVLRLSEMYPGATQAQIEAAAPQTIVNISAQLQIDAAAKGISLAAEVYKHARAMGYTGQQAAAAAAAAPAAPPQSKGQARMAA